MDTSIEFNIYGDASLLKEAQNVLDKVLYELSGQMKNSYSRSIRMELVH